MKIYNTLSRSKEEFVPINGKKVGIYSCGPTVYSSPHIGNMYGYICWDVLNRTLKYLGYDVTHVVNITDVGHLVSDADSGEDKMEKGARKDGVSVWDVAKKYENEFLENLKTLNITEPNFLPKATEYIQEQIDMVKVLEKNGFTYQIDDGIYYDTSKFDDYAKFANLNLEMIKEGARVEFNEQKRNPSDFALWKFSPTDGTKRQMEWESPWGVGFPGWHIECTAMSTKLLGDFFDIHTGGEDHINVHHTNEIAQGFGALGHNTAKYWMHNAFITFNGAKISKSTGGLFTIFDLIEMGYDPMAFRYMVLSSQYRKGIDFSLDSLKAAQVAYEKLVVLWFKWKSTKDTRGGQVSKKYNDEFVKAISDDLAMPEAIAILWKMIKSDLNDADKLATLIEFDKIFGFNFGPDSRKKEEIPQEVVDLNNKRQEARADKNWTEADRLREEIKKMGYVVEDSQESCTISKLQ